MRKGVLGCLGCTGLIAVLLVIGVVGGLVLGDDVPHAAATSSPVSPVESGSVIDLEPQPPPEPKPYVGLWRKSVSRSQFDDSKTVTISVEANSSVQAWLSRPTPVLVVRCHENKTEVYINNGTATESEYPAVGLGRSRVRFRFDDGAAKTRVGHDSSDRDAIFFTPAIPLVRKLLDSKSLTYGFTPFNSDPQVTTFALAGLSNQIEELQEACGWDDQAVQRRKATRASEAAAARPIAESLSSLVAEAKRLEPQFQRGEEQACRDVVDPLRQQAEELGKQAAKLSSKHRDTLVSAAKETVRCLGCPPGTCDYAESWLLRFEAE